VPTLALVARSQQPLRQFGRGLVKVQRRLAIQSSGAGRTRRWCS
jgi:hypothetical protein